MSKYIELDKAIGAVKGIMARLETVHVYDPLEIECDVVEARCSNCGRYCTQLVTDGLVHYNFCPWCGEKVRDDRTNQ